MHDVEPTRLIRLAPRLALLVVGLLLLALLTGACQLDVDGGLRYQPIPVQPGAVGRVVASTVDVRVSAPPENGLVRQSLGTGVIISRDGVVVTALHVVTMDDRGPVDSIEVILADGRHTLADLVAKVPGRDLALLAIRLDDLHPAQLVPDLTGVQAGDRVFAVGAPHRFVRRVARGRVLEIVRGMPIAQGRQPGTLIATSARIRRGFSGGPLADARGHVIGINLATAEGGAVYRRSSLAVPAPVVLAALAQLRQAAPD